MDSKHNEINIANCCIEVEACCVEYDNILALDNVSFSIPKGSFIGVLGPNGGGKSTLFNAIAGLENLTHGKIKINGKSSQKSLQKVYKQSLQTVYKLFTAVSWLGPVK